MNTHTIVLQITTSRKNTNRLHSDIASTILRNCNVVAVNYNQDILRGKQNE